MAVPYTGIGTGLGLGEESTYGTADTRDNWLFVNSVTPKSKRVKAVVPHLGVSGDVGAARHYRTERTEYGLDVEIPFAYEDSSLMLLRHCLGALSTTGSTPWTHTFRLDNTLSNPAGLTCEVLKGNSGRSEVYEGGKVQNATLSLTQGEQMRLSASLIFETSTRAAAGTPTYHSTTPVWVEYDHAGNVSWNSLTFSKVVSVEISVDRKVDRRTRLGSTDTQEPTRTDSVSVTIRMTVDWDDADAVLDDHLGTDQSDWTLTLAPATGNEQMVITGHNAICTDVSQGISGRGVLQRTYEFMTFADTSTDRGLTIAITNDNSTYTSN